MGFFSDIADRVAYEIRAFFPERKEILVTGRVISSRTEKPCSGWNSHLATLHEVYDGTEIARVAQLLSEEEHDPKRRIEVGDRVQLKFNTGEPVVINNPDIYYRITGYTIIQKAPKAQQHPKEHEHE